MKDFYRETYAEIDLQALTYNIKEMKKILPDSVHLFAAVKANAYGHGEVECAKAAIKAGAKMLLVAYLDEAITLRNAGISEPILVLGTTSPDNVVIAAKYNISLTVFDLNWLKYAEEKLCNNNQINVHIKCDTGMGRIGLKEIAELTQIEKKINTANCFVFTGIYTHFATADQHDDDYYEGQLNRFKQLVHHLKEKPQYIHAANSAATLVHNDSFFNAVRVGIAMYGLTPSIEIENELPIKLKEVFSLHSSITYVKKIKAGEKIGYGATYAAETDEWIATIPIGYGDGWLRKLSGQEVLINEQRMPIIGRICMDQMMVRLSEYISIGTKVTLMGKQGNEMISVNEIASKLETINYEVTCMITQRVPRIYI